ncbi:MAG: hypothetical protein ACFCVF_07725 [Kineosporiaceae bacterium]
MSASEGPRRLAPQLARAWRGPGAVQFGTDPARAVVLSGLEAEDRRVLDLLDRGVSATALESDARRRGTDPRRPALLLELLDRHGLLVATDRGGDAARARLRAEAWCRAVPRHRRGRGTGSRPARSVGVVGRTGLAVAIGAGFAAAGIGTVAVSPAGTVSPVDVMPGGATAAEVGGSLRAAGEAAVDRVAPGTRHTGRAAPDLGVIVSRHAHDAAEAATWLASDVPHLAVLVRECDVVVGPLVIPGRGPCLHCLDLARRDRDPQWPTVLPQLLEHRDDTAAGPVPGLGQVAAGLAVLVGLAALDGDGAEAAGLAATLALPYAVPAWRRWAAHPACGCARWDARTRDEAENPGEGRVRTGVTISG